MDDFKCLKPHKIYFSQPWPRSETIKNYLSVRMCVTSLTAYLLARNYVWKKWNILWESAKKINDPVYNERTEKKKWDGEKYQLLVIAVKWWWMAESFLHFRAVTSRRFIKFFPLSLLTLKQRKNKKESRIEGIRWLLIAIFFLQFSQSVITLKKLWLNFSFHSNHNLWLHIATDIKLLLR